MESLATLDLPAYGYGIRYVNGMFRQRIDDGWQVELPETWLAHGNPWEFERRESAYLVGFGGEVIGSEDGACPLEARRSGRGDGGRHAGGRLARQAGQHAAAVDRERARSDPARCVQRRRLMSARSPGRCTAESLVRVLYPADINAAGQELRLRQEYFFSSASIQDIVRRHVQYFGDIRTLPDKAAIQLNDTHPAVAVAELMRLLIDQHDLGFDEAWDITQRTFGYTNHTLLPEALESWPLPLFERLLPRHMQLIYAINAELLREARKAGLDDRAISAISLIDENGERRVRMANLAFAGSHSVNGVAALHTELMKQTVFADLHRLYPDRINNKTNGITPRRWLQQCNPGLTGLIREAIGDGLPRRCREARRPGCRSPTTPAFRSGSPRSSAPTRWRWPASARTDGPSASIPTPCSTSRSSASTNTSASCSTSSRRSRSTTRSAAIPSATGCRG